MNITNSYAALASLVLLETGRADPLDHWTWRNPAPTGYTLSAVVYANNQFVAVDSWGTILNSPDGFRPVAPSKA